MRGDGERWTSERRRQLIRDRVVEHGSVRIDDMAAELGVTVMTIHRDLNLLEGEGWLRKVRGGAIVDSSALIDTTVRHRLTAMVEAKQQIARCAVQYATQGDAVMIDDSTTALEVARLLPGRGPLTVITNFLMAINALAGESDIELIALGGTYNAAHDAFHGLHVREAMSKLRANVLFMSTTAILDGTLYHKSQDTILIRHSMMEVAARRILLADHSKFGRHAVHQLGSILDFDAVIVDGDINDRELHAMRERGAHVVVADEGSGRGSAAPWPDEAGADGRASSKPG